MLPKIGTTNAQQVWMELRIQMQIGIGLILRGMAKASL